MNRKHRLRQRRVKQITFLDEYALLHPAQYGQVMGLVQGMKLAVTSLPPMSREQAIEYNKRTDERISKLLGL